jgi:uncharacterized protein YjiS (DUF1127 family)
MSTCIHETMTNNHAHGVFGQLLEMLHTWRHRQHGRQELAKWSERDLHDVGLSRGDVIFEAGKPFWRA